jgi:CubicO group peptidase (beta-lactamase class C family)
MFINARDMARFGLLTANNGKWRDKQILSENWIKMARTPTGAQPTYGFMNWFLNTDRKFFPAAPANAFAHIGNGTNIIYVDPDKDLVFVLRWIENDKINEFIQKINACFKD